MLKALEPHSFVILAQIKGNLSSLTGAKALDEGSDELAVGNQNLVNTTGGMRPQEEALDTVVLRDAPHMWSEIHMKS